MVLVQPALMLRCRPAPGAAAAGTVLLMACVLLLVVVVKRRRGKAGGSIAESLPGWGLWRDRARNQGPHM